MGRVQSEFHFALFVFALLSQGFGQDALVDEVVDVASEQVEEEEFAKGHCLDGFLHVGVGAEVTF